MKEGFRKTGMYRFDSDLLRGTVNPRLEVEEEEESKAQSWLWKSTRTCSEVVLKRYGAKKILVRMYPVEESLPRVLTSAQRKPRWKRTKRAKGLRNRKRNIETVEESATGSEDDSPTTQGYPCQAPPKRQRKTAKQVAAEIASDVTAPPPNMHFTVNVPEGNPSKRRPQRATARAKTTPAPRKKPPPPVSKTKVKMLPLPKTKPRVSAVKSKSKKT
ncbi:hypothetical protein RvY_01682 [Ramazzottius varieornatus]|uniref:Uncharacterized protein n=1 Tax=Ramazzottius varieornatus TaxID=947166 RepID=A0A1D1USD3_RAMVA|nr:hypothetical protein RvY_01682 [Ramazzottius varieornatus]